MEKAFYQGQIEAGEFEGANQVSYLRQIIEFVKDDTELTDDERLLLETQVSLIIQELSPPVEESSNKTPVAAGKKKIFPTYSFEESFSQPDIVSSFNPKNLDYPQWFEKEFLPRFYPLPNDVLQNKIVAAIAMVNCRAVLSKKMKIPNPYFLGIPGSGKTELALTIGAQYPKGSFREFKNDTTGAGFRNGLDAISGYGEPCLAVMDNFNPSPTYSFDRLGSYYSLLLTNNEEQSVCQIAGGGSDDKKSIYRTYSYKIITSIFDLRSFMREEAKEVARRCWTVMFKPSNPQEQKTLFDLEGMHEGYLSVWGDPKKVRTEYGKILSKVVKGNYSKYNLPPSIWEILYVPIAVGVFCNIFSSIDEAVESFVEHHKYASNKSKDYNISRLNILLTEYVQIERKQRAESAMVDAEFAPKVELEAYTHIRDKDILDYLKPRMGTLNKQQEQDYTMMMIEWGYSMKQFDREVWFIMNK